MESKSTSGVLRRNRRLAPRYYPYAIGSVKEEVVRLGVKLSLSVAESMFLLCDDIRTMLSFCFKLWRDANRYPNPVLDRLLRVSHNVYSKYIKPKNGVFQNDGNSVQWRLIRTTWEDFAEGIIVMHRLVLLATRKDCSFDDRLLLSAIEKYKQLMKKLEDKLRSAKDVSEANGFTREKIRSNIFDLWKSLFDEEAKEATQTLLVIRTRISSDLFRPIVGKPFHSEILALPPHSPCILGMVFIKQELKEEAVRLGVELSLYVAQSMFLLCDDIHSMLRFCLKLWRDVKRDLKPGSPVGDRLLCVIHYVYSSHIKPKNGVYQIGCKSVQCELIRKTWENSDAGIRDLDRLVLILREEGRSCLDGGPFTWRIEEALNKLDDKLRCVKDVSEANGFAREAIESNILDLWKSLFHKEAKKVIKIEILTDLFHPLLKEKAESKH